MLAVGRQGVRVVRHVLCERRRPAASYRVGDVDRRAQLVSPGHRHRRDAREHSRCSQPLRRARWGRTATLVFGVAIFVARRHRPPVDGRDGSVRALARSRESMVLGWLLSRLDGMGTLALAPHDEVRGGLGALYGHHRRVGPNWSDS
jgi:hypothetical protein